MTTTFVPLGHGQHCVKRQAVAGGVIGFFQAPGLTGLAQNFDKGFEVVLLVRLCQHLVGVRDHDEVALSRQPVEVCQTFFEGIPVVAEIVREREDPAELIQQPSLGFAFLAGDGLGDKMEDGE